jgi:hypothetical protein
MWRQFLPPLVGAASPVLPIQMAVSKFSNKSKLHLFGDSQTVEENLSIPGFLPYPWVQESTNSPQPDHSDVLNSQWFLNVVVHTDTIELVLHFELVIQQTLLLVFPPPLLRCLGH